MALRYLRTAVPQATPRPATIVSPRSPTISDPDILIRATRAVRQHGPHVTLAQIAAIVGLSAARLVQRFGSRSALLTAVEASVDSRVLQQFRTGLLGIASPIDAIVDSLSALAGRSARRMYLLSNSYVFDPRHLGEPGAAEQAQARIADFEGAVSDALQRAVLAGELRETDTHLLAHAVFVCWVGAYNLWAYAPVGAVRDAVRRDLNFTLAPFRTSTDRLPTARARADRERARRNSGVLHA